MAICENDPSRWQSFGQGTEPRSFVWANTFFGYISLTATERGGKNYWIMGVVVSSAPIRFGRWVWTTNPDDIQQALLPIHGHPQNLWNLGSFVRGPNFIGFLSRGFVKKDDYLTQSHDIELGNEEHNGPKEARWTNGCYFDMMWQTIPADTMKPLTDDQTRVFNEIKSLMETGKTEKGYYFGAFLLWGPPGTGKTRISHLLASHFNSTFTEDYDPLEPSCDFEEMVRRLNPTHDKPLFVSIDEADEVWKKAITGTPQGHEFFRVNTRNRSSLNKQMDRMANTRNVIVIYTANHHPREAGVHESCWRDGRIMKRFWLNQPLAKNAQESIFGVINHEDGESVGKVI